jgi:hypothetical protein
MAYVIVRIIQGPEARWPNVSPAAEALGSHRDGCHRAPEVRHLSLVANRIRAMHECRASGALGYLDISAHPGLPPLGSRLAIGPPGLALLFIDPISNPKKLFADPISDPKNPAC